MPSEKFLSEFLDFSKKIPLFKDGEMVYLIFTVIYEKEKPGSRSLMVVSYRNPEEEVELVIQSPKENIMEKMNLKKLKTTKIEDRKFYIGYVPEPRAFITLDGKSYTYLNDKVWTVIAENKDAIKSLEFKTPLKFDKDILNYAKIFKEDLNGFSLCMLQWNKFDSSDRSQMIFSNPEKKTEMWAEILKDDREALQSFQKDIKNKKKLDKFSYEVELEGKKVLLSVIDKERILVSKCLKGKKELLKDFTRTILKKLR